jgi:GT2 family glycosyltransferase/Tfp pilus assembly protein PilF
MKTASIIIPVHNQKELLEKCINSLIKKTKNSFQLILVDDSSNIETSTYCKKLRDQDIVSCYLQNQKPMGFSYSCNRGLRAFKSDYYCLLNSDTEIGTYNWLEKIINVGESDKDIGILGVVSNNATSQSVPSEGNLLPNFTVDSFSNLIEILTENNNPEVPLINGFCYIIKNSALEKVGFFDEKKYPHYGSEDNYTFLAAKKGFKSVIVDSVFVYHKSNCSYKGLREKIVSVTIPQFNNDWGLKKVKEAIEKSYAALQYLRDKIELQKNNLQNYDKVEQVDQNKSFKCDIIVVVHNALEHVKKCVESIKSNTDDYVLYIVDNNSNFQTKQYLKTIIDKKIILIENNKNFGFGYANNIAIRKTTSEYVCFLNSDTIVSKDWLKRLIVTLNENNAGFVGPVTNNISLDLQQIKFSGDVQQFAEQRHITLKNSVTNTNRLVGFCLLTKREILNNIGIFDDRYDFNFEDDDLCLRAVEKCYKLFVANGVFVYHAGSQSFKEKYKTITPQYILEKSKNLFNQKWYQTQRINKLNEKKPSYSIGYLLASDCPSGGVKIIIEHVNRLKDRGHNVRLFCLRKESNNWFKTNIEIEYITEEALPYTDVLVGTYFTTLPIVQKSNSLVKLHLCQGYEALLYNEHPHLKSVVEENYKLIKDKIVVSKWLKQIIDKQFELDTNYVRNAIELNDFSLKKHSRNLEVRILIPGNYNLEIKGVKVAVEAAQAFLKQVKGKIVRLASEKTDFDSQFEFHDMTKLSQEQIAKVYQTCDVTICASHKVEGFSLHPLESMASGTPVVTTDNGGVNEYAIANHNSLIIPVNDVQKTISALQVLFHNGKLYNRLVERGIETANDYQWYKSIDMLESVLDNLYSDNIAKSKEQLSVCMIVKNEQQNLERCLSSIEKIATEIIIVDTGSTDDTIKIAKKFNAKIFHYEWDNDFSAARNFSLSKATQEWILVVDADEAVSKRDLNKIKELLKTKKAYSFKTRNYVKIKNVDNLELCRNEYEEENGYLGWISSTKVRLFPNNQNIKFEGKIHELVEKTVSIEIEETNVPIHHFGKTNKEKSNLYLKLGQEKVKENDEDQKAIYELAVQYMALNNFDEALILWRRLITLDPNNEELYARKATTYNLLKDYKAAIKFFNKSIEIKPTEYAYSHLGIAYAKLNMYQEAYDSLKNVAFKTVELKVLGDFAFCCSELRKYDDAITILEKCMKLNKQEALSWKMLEIAYNEKGIALAKQNKLRQAYVMFKNAIIIDPDFVQAKANLSAVEKIIGKL